MSSKKLFLPALLFILVLLVLVSGLILVDIASRHAAEPSSIPQANSETGQGLALVYQMNVAEASTADVDAQMAYTQELVANRLSTENIGVSSIETDGEKLTIELRRPEDAQLAQETIKTIPVLSFKEEMTEEEKATLRKQHQDSGISEQYMSLLYYQDTGLDGRHLKSAEVYFDPDTYEPEVLLRFNDAGTKLFSDISARNIGRKVGIFLDEAPISIPIVEDAITDGVAIISGDFTYQEAKTLSERLNSGALPARLDLVK